MKDEANATVAEWVEPVKFVSGLAAQYALATATWTPQYREPGQSISDVDEQFGSTSDVEDPLLTAHRFAKFYLISAGDCLNSLSKLLDGGYPSLVGSSAIARAAAEHASRSIYMSDANVDHSVRMLRVAALVAASLREYKSSNDAGATILIKRWESWKARTSKEFKNVPKQTLGTATRLLERYFSDGAIGYEELSRPTHGNATWLAITVVSEQKGTAGARIFLMRNAMFSTRCVVSAINSLANLWGLDLDSVAQAAGGDLVVDPPLTWSRVEGAVRELTEVVASLDERHFVDSTPVPQPRR
ncbi:MULTISPECIES: hypothetical protein [Mycobacteriaceae]|uniref:hypothetical protein n=1 Tax=Mycobacteriaceae TaxID=1762 RepID=UPI000B1158A7|nr:MULTISPECIES: hypothetical protein [Mycobacteriaceae]